MIQVFHSVATAKAALGSCAVTIGKYDGMHLGHQRILRQLKQEAQRLAVPSLVILSEPQPEEFFAGDKAPPRLNAFHDKVKFLAGFGIDAVYCLRFDAEVSRQSAEDFVEQMLLQGLGMQALVVGEDFRFGHQRRGNIATLRKLADAHAFTVTAVAPCLDEGERISSTLIRQYLDRGDCARVSRCLGRPYAISGKVIHGKQLGRELGFPTANIELCSNKLALAGIFAVAASHDGTTHNGVASIGYNPTVNDQRLLSLEVHVLDFAADLYGHELTVNFLHKLRDECKFADFAALKRQMEQDVTQARQLLERQP